MSGTSTRPSSSDGLPYYRLSGNGNDFLALAEPAGAPTADQVRAWCRRGVGLGADGLFVLTREHEGELGRDGVPVLRMVHFNADGGEAELCLNGTRCAARLAFALGWADDEVVIRTPAGALRARPVDPGTVRVEVPIPEPPERLTLRAPQGPLSVGFLTVGVPHAVLEWAGSLESLDPEELGPWLRRHERFPTGANVDFVRFPERHRLEIRTWERGVEGETLACGTGILAATRVGVECGRLALPVDVQTLGGFPTRVEEAEATVWALVSDARLLASGRITEEASSTPPPPRWSS